MTHRVVVLARSPQISVAARATVREHADELGPQRTADACLLVSELATNAFRHGTGEIRLGITVRGALARFSIHDDGDGTPRMSLRPGEHGGWGLHLVDRVAARWGIQTASTLVWFELHASRPPADPPRLPRSAGATLRPETATEAGAYGLKPPERDASHVTHRAEDRACSCDATPGPTARDRKTVAESDARPHLVKVIYEGSPV